jgi:hypothetical protein
VIVTFATMRLRDLCAILARADAEWGPNSAKALFGLLADIEATETAGELLSLYGDVTSFGEGICYCMGKGHSSTKKIMHPQMN